MIARSQILIFCCLISPLFLGSCSTLKTVEESGPVKIFLVPDADEPEGGQVFLDMKFDGQVRHAILDTGGQHTKVKNDPFFADYASTDEKKLMGLSGSSVSVSKILIREVNLGSEKLGAFEVARVPEKLGIETTGGVDLFQGRQFAFDFKAKTLSFDVPLVEGSNLTITKTGQFLVPVYFGKKSVQMVWDTGAGLTTVDQEFIKKHPKDFKFLKALNVGDVVQKNAFQLKLYEANELKVGGFVFKKVKVLAADFGPLWKKLEDTSIHGALGYNILTQLNWAFDLKSQKFSVSK